MKKILWYSSTVIIFINTLFEVAWPNFPFGNSVLTSFCVLAILFMLYVFFFEQKSSTILRTTSLILGMAGVAKLVLGFIAVNSFVANAILLGITFVVMLIVMVPAIIGTPTKQ